MKYKGMVLHRKLEDIAASLVTYVLASKLHVMLDVRQRNGERSTKDIVDAEREHQISVTLHPSWRSMIRFCQEMGCGEIARIKIHDGLPISAELVTKKIRWYRVEVVNLADRDKRRPPGAWVSAQGGLSLLLEKSHAIPDFI